MPIYKESFFRIFHADVRSAFRKFFENRSAHVTAELASEFTDAATLAKLSGLELLEFDGENNQYRLDDRLERFLEEMLGAAEVAQADWLRGLLEELNRSIEGHQKLAIPSKADALLRRILRLLRVCDSRAQRHLEDIKSAVDFDYRAGSDYELKLMKLQWHLERSRSYGEAIAELDNLLRNGPFFQFQQGLEMMISRSRLIRRCGQVGDALIDIYQRIEEYLNRVQRDYARAQKLIRLRSLIERHEHLSTTNIEEIASTSNGPWFREFRYRTSLDLTVIDDRPELVEKALTRSGLEEQRGKTRPVKLTEYPPEEIPPIIDWQDVVRAFSKQQDDLFLFLGKVRVDGRLLTEDERIDGFCSILSNEDWADAWHEKDFAMAEAQGWEYAVIKPSALSA